MRLLIITGLPATGKTTLALELARHYRVPLLAKDSVKEVLLDALGAGDEAHSRRLSDVSFAVLFSLARQACGNADLILEGNFRSGQHEGALRKCSQAQTAQVLCQTEESARKARIAARPYDPSRHPGHHDRPHAAPNPATGRFLELPGPRFALDSSPNAEPSPVLEQIERWWRENGP